MLKYIQVKLQTVLMIGEKKTDDRMEKQRIRLTNIASMVLFVTGSVVLFGWLLFGYPLYLNAILGATIGMSLSVYWLNYAGAFVKARVVLMMLVLIGCIIVFPNNGPAAMVTGTIWSASCLIGILSFMLFNDQQQYIRIAFAVCAVVLGMGIEYFSSFLSYDGPHIDNSLHFKLSMSLIVITVFVIAYVNRTIESKVLLHALNVARESERNLKLLMENLEDKVRDRTKELEYRQTKYVMQSEKLVSLGTMVAGIVHDIKTPRATVDHYITILEKQLSKWDADSSRTDQETMLSNIQKVILPEMALANERIGEITDSLMRYIRLDSDLVKRFKPAEVIESALIVTRSQYKYRIQVFKELDPTCEVMGFSGEFSQAMVNLITNACQAIPSEGNVSIGCYKKGDHVIVTIKDDGTGIPDEVLPRIFDPFFTTKEAGQGTGIGLSMTKKIVESHNGQLRVNSKFGVGTEFIIEMPAANGTN